MINRRTVLATWLGITLSLGVALPAVAVNAAEPKIPLAVVVAKNSPLSEMSFHELKRLYLGDAVSGPNGRKLIPLAQHAGSKDRLGFDRSVLGMSAEAVARYWIDRKIRGQPGAPKAVDSVDVLKRVVGNVEGSVGYLRADQVRGDVKVLRIDGKSPGEVGYRVEY
jgi:hypothetical protein